MGAMAAAARLATAGHDVAVHERGSTYGGGVRRLERAGFGFDTGPALLRLPAVYRDLFIKTGRKPLEQCVSLTTVDPAARHLFADSTEVTLPNASQAGATAALDAALGHGTGARWAAVLGRGRAAWDATRRPLLEEPLAADWRAAGLADDPYPPVSERRGLLRRRHEQHSRRLAEIGTYELHDPRLTALLESQALGYGFDPRTAPASAAVLPYMEQTFGVWYVHGGIRALATAVYERCRERGVTFTFDSPVAALVRKEDRAAGLELADGTVVDADAVVAGVSPARLDGLGAEDAADAPDAAAPDDAAQVGMPGRVTVCLALRGARPAGTAHRTVVHTQDRAAELDWIFRGGPLTTAPTVTVLRPDDSAQRPDDAHEAVTLTATAPDWNWSEPGVAEDFADRMQQAATAALPGLAERVLWREIRTPADTEAETGAAGGAVPGPALAGAGGAYLVGRNATRLPGLYAVGGWSHPGGGLAHAGMSGALVAGLITEGPDFRGSQ
ncbi:NAD(P)/FAD-dependent oxidoreductase [Streptomyces sp. A7024]|uniref:NAD(P)/FAD-dependent oxidoreductase n=2 Tax=Streptomyces coryli TaxID=1128680 RepID=A0A6G4U2L3_9ACTN|nr:NAD(P)/FAD-dependent oxidoreductase [Streptomyces coryli]